VEVRFFEDARETRGPDRRPVRTVRLVPREDDPRYFEARVDGIGEGALYDFLVDGRALPDPFARSLPFGVHGPARVVAPRLAPADAEPFRPALPVESWVIYELHVGTFSPEGTFAGAAARLDHLVSLGVNAIELLPVASFAGARGWGYDGVALYAPHPAYGSLDDLRALIAAAHARGLAVLLDVVYNHFGPAGNYLASYATEYFARDVKTPWGDAPDFAHPPMRGLALENARFWLEELGFDGLRLDATHAIVDPSPRHVLRAIADLAHSMDPPRVVMFEDERNDPTILDDLAADAVWADDFHHQVHVLLTGERDGYYAAYEPSVEALARTIRRGWRFEGEPYPPWKNAVRGKPLPSDRIAPHRLVYTLQNHDQIGNRALGDRLSQVVDVESYLAVSALLLFLPMIPLLFMGQEWAASSPFLFFSDHEGDLGEAVRNGRREEFAAFAAFADPERRKAIPDPQAESTFTRSKLAWDERERGDHARSLRVYRELLALRRDDPVLSAPCGFADLEVVARGRVLEIVRRHAGAVRRLVVRFAPEVDEAREGVGPAGEELLPEGARVLFRTRDEHAEGVALVNVKLDPEAQSRRDALLAPGAVILDR